MIEDIKYAFRQLRKNRGFAAGTIATLALGIGAAAAMFNLVQGVLLSPPPFPEPDRLVLLQPARIDGQPYTQGATLGHWIDARSTSRSFEPPALYRWTFNLLVRPDGSESLGGMVVTENVFQVLGLRPIVGRGLTAADASGPKAPATGILLGYELWQRRFNGDHAIVGTAVRISRFPAPLTVVGVMPRGIRFLPDPGRATEPNYDVNAHVDFWIAAAPDETQTRAGGWNLLARVRDHVTTSQVASDVRAVAERQAAANPALQGVTLNPHYLLEEMNREARTLLLPLFGSVAILFIVACVNVAGLYVARGLRRHREYAMRSALGASRIRLFRQLLTEALVLSAAGAVVGASVAALAIDVILRVAGHAIPRADAVTVGWPVVVFGAAAALVAALVAGFVPALRAASPDHFDGLKGGRMTAGRTERRLLGGIATAQIVFTVTLLAGAALLIRTAANLARVQPGYQTENILALTVTSVNNGSPDAFRGFHTRVLERVSALPGVRGAAFVWGLPLTGNKWPGTIVLGAEQPVARATEQVDVPLRSVTPDYFRLMDIDLVEGRSFAASDSETSPRVGMVNQAFARRYFAGMTPLGKRVRFAGDNDPKRVLEIVGVVSDTRTDALNRQAEPELYLPFWQSGAFSKHLVVRAAGDPQRLIALVRNEIRGVDPTAAAERPLTMRQIRAASVRSRTFAMQLVIGFALLAAALAVVGVYGVMSLSVGSRIKEIAVRKALGAQDGAIVRMILRDGGYLVGTGVLIGSVVALVFGRALESQLFGVSPADPLSFGAAAAAFSFVAFGACAVPAFRAGRTNLLRALHRD